MNQCHPTPGTPLAENCSCGHVLFAHVEVLDEARNVIGGECVVCLMVDEMKVEQRRLLRRARRRARR